MSSEEGQRLLSNQAEDESEDEEVLFNAHGGERATPSSAPHAASSGPASVPVEPPPSYNNQQPATLAPITLSSRQPPPSSPHRNPPPHGVPSFPVTASAAGAPALSEKPPDYSLHPPQDGNYPGKAGMAVHIQIDGRLVPGTIMEDTSGRHMVYICQPQQPMSQPPSAAATASGDLHQPVSAPPCPKDYFILSLLSLLCCCAPLGLFALIKSMEVHRLYRRGDYAGAVRASKQAHSWGSAAVVFGATMVVVLFALKLYFSESSHGTHYYYYQ